MPDNTNITEDNTDNRGTLTDEKLDQLITWALHKHAEETITDEQIQRILAPVHARIAAGEFSKGASATGGFPRHRPHTHCTGPRSR